MTEADILALTYQDSCWVYRPSAENDPALRGERVPEGAGRQAGI